MATSSKNSARRVNVLGKRKPEDDLETKSDEADLISPKETAVPKKTLFIGHLSRRTEISDIIDFFKDVAEVVSVRLSRNHKGFHMGYGFVEFASANEANKALQKKNGQYLHYCKIVLEETQQDYQSEEVAVPKKTLFVAHLSRETTEISDIINFFKDVGQVVRVRLIVDDEGSFLGCGLVEFASANAAKMSLQIKNGEYLHDRKVNLDVATTGATFIPPKHCIDHKVWDEEDYLQGESLPTEEDAAVEGLDESPDYEKRNTPEEVLLVANLSPQTTRLVHIIDFFKDVGRVVSVRLIVNHEGKHVGYGFVEFGSAYEAKKALEEKNGKYLHDHKILLMKGFGQTPDIGQAVSTIRLKTVFVSNLSPETEIPDIINFFKDVGEVVNVRLIVDYSGHHTGCGFVEFASANKAKKALEKKNGEYLHNSEITILDVANVGARYLDVPRYCIDHKVWYEDYIGRESHVIEEDVAAVEGLDETPDYSEEIAVRKKTVFVAKRSCDIRIPDIIKIFKNLGEVVRVRHIVDHWGELVGCCFVELTTANEAMKAVRYQDGHKFFLNVAEIDRPYPFRPKYNLAGLVEKLWHEDNLLRESLCRKKTKLKMSKQSISEVFRGIISRSREAAESSRGLTSIQGDAVKSTVFLLESVDADSEIWKLADVRENRDPTSKGRPLSRKQRDLRIKLPFSVHRKITLYLD